MQWWATSQWCAVQNEINESSNVQGLLLEVGTTYGSLRARANQGNWQLQWNCNFWELSPISSRQLVSRLGGAHWGKLCLSSYSHHLKWVCLPANFVPFCSAILDNNTENYAVNQSTHHILNDDDDDDDDGKQRLSRAPHLRNHLADTHTHTHTHTQPHTYTHTHTRLLHLMRNSSPSQIYFVPPSIVWVAFVIYKYTRLFLS
jgi:hypothetical protein